MLATRPWQPPSTDDYRAARPQRTAVEYQQLADRQDLRPNKSGGSVRILCPEGCDDKHRHKSYPKRSAQLNENGTIKCHKCGIATHVTKYIDETNEAPYPRRFSPFLEEKEEGAQPPVDMKAVETGLVSMRYWFEGELKRWGREHRGWSEAVAREVGRVPGLVYVPDPYKLKGDLARFCRYQRELRVCLLMHGYDGEPTSAERRWGGVGERPRNRPKALSMPSKVVGSNAKGRFFGDMTRAGEAECVVVVEGMPDYVGACALVQAMEWTKALVIGAPGCGEYRGIGEHLWRHVGPTTRVIAAPHANDSHSRTREWCDAMLLALRRKGIETGVLELEGFAKGREGYDVADLLRDMRDHAVDVVGGLLRRTWEGCEGPSADEDVELEGVELERGRRLTRSEIARTAREAGSVHIAASCGVGKTYALVEEAAAHMLENRKGFFVYVAKDRLHAVELRDAIDERVGHGQQTLLLVGRGGQVPEDPGSWRPRWDAANDQVSTCGNPDVLVQLMAGKKSSDCSACPLKEACTTRSASGALGTKGMLDELHSRRKEDTRGNVVVVTLPMLPSVLATLGGDNTRVVALDDVAYPNPSELRLDLLEDALMRDQGEGDPPLAKPWEEKIASWVSAIRADVFLNNRTYTGQWRGGPDALELLEGIDWEKIAEIGAESDMHRALSPIADAARQPGAPRLYINFEQDGGVTVGAYGRALALPNHTALIVANATAQTEVWRAYFGRERLPKLTIRVQVPDVVEGVNLENSAFQRARWEVSHHHEDLDRRARSAGLALKRELGDRIADKGLGLRGLIVAHQRQLADARFDQVTANMLDAAGLSQATFECIHWRGVEQTGSNRYSDYDLIITLGTPLPNLGAWQRLAAAVRAWKGDGEAILRGYRDEASGLQEQAVGRLRWVLAEKTKLLIHIGKEPGHTLASLCPEPARVDANRPAVRKHEIEDWSERSWPHQAWSVPLHNLEGGTRASWRRFCDDLDLPTWHIQTGRTITIWHSATSDEALAAAQHLLDLRQRPGQTPTLIPPEDPDLTVAGSGVSFACSSIHFRPPSPTPVNTGSDENVVDPLGADWPQQWKTIHDLSRTLNQRDFDDLIDDLRYCYRGSVHEDLRVWLLARLTAGLSRIHGNPVAEALDYAAEYLLYDGESLGIDDPRACWQRLYEPLKQWTEGLEPDPPPLE